MEKAPVDRFAGAADLVAALASPPADAQPTVEVPSPRPSGSSPARRAGLALATVLLVSVVLAVSHRLATGHTKLDPATVAVLPFRVTAPDHALDYLGEGIVDLLAVKLSGPAGPHAVPPRRLLDLLRYKPGMEVTAEQGEDAARRAGAGLLLDGSLVRSGAKAELSADLRPTNGQGRIVHATVAGLADSVPSLVDRLAAQLMAGLGQRTTSLGDLSTSRAIGEYLQGIAAHRRGQYTIATSHFAAALQEDSTFALAALDMLASIRGDNIEAANRASRLAWASRAKLSPRGRALLRAWVGPNYPAPSSMILTLAAWQDAVTAAPDLPDARFELGDKQLHFGALNDLPHAVEFAARNFSRGLELDSNFTWPLDHLLFCKFWLDDTTGVRALAHLWLAQDTTSGDRSDYFRWRIALALGDSAEIARQRARLDRWQDESVLWLAGAAQSEAVGLGDVQLAIEELERRAVTGPRLVEARQRRREWLLNSGQPSLALALTDSLAAAEPYSGWARLTRIDDALFWDGDTATAAADVRALTRSVAPARDSVARSVRARGHCRLGLWSLTHGDRAGVVRWLSELRGERLTSMDVFNDDDRAMCVRLLDAWSVMHDDRGKALALLQQSDSIYLNSDIMADYPVTNLVTARIREAAGDLAGARRAIERTGIELFSSPQYQSTYLREQARLELEAGDTASATRALRRYVALRAHSETPLRSEVDSARAELSLLLGR
jgi:tetratricopeptide (TPR) repeat protein